MFGNVKMQGFRGERNEDDWSSWSVGYLSFSNIYEGLKFEVQVGHGVHKLNL